MPHPTKAELRDISDCLQSGGFIDQRISNDRFMVAEWPDGKLVCVNHTTIYTLVAQGKIKPVKALDNRIIYKGA